jgi:hypothetical protein
MDNYQMRVAGPEHAFVPSAFGTRQVGRVHFRFTYLEEWMNPRTRLFRGLAMTALLGVGLAACEDDVILPSDPTISVAPASITLTTGQTQQIVGSVSDGTGVTFESLNTAVATVAANGNTATVTAVGVGNATIRVTSSARPALQTAVNVTVNAPVLPPSDTADVTIEGIFQAQTISPVDPDSVVNTIDITMGVDRGDADKLTVKVNGQEIPACTQTFTSSSAEITAEGLSIGAALTSVVCSLDTRAFTRGTGDDANRGIPTYPNGPLSVLVELTKNGTVLSSAERSGFTLANSDFMQAYVATYVAGSTTQIRPSVLGDTGLQWFGNGDLEVLLVPVIFSASSQTSPGYPAQVTLNFDAYRMGNDVTLSRSVTDRTAGGFVVRFPRSGGGAANSDAVNTGREGTRINVISTTNGGQPGPQTAYGPITGNPLSTNRVHFTELQSGTALLNSILRFDNENPQAGRLQLPPHPQVGRIWARNGWVNSAVNFFAGKDGSHDAPYFLGGGAVGPAGTGSTPSSAYGSLSALPGGVVFGVGQDSIVIYAQKFAAGAGATTAAGVITGGTRLGASPTATSANLDPTLTNREWSIAARVWDRLGNFSDVLITRADTATGVVAGTEQTGETYRIGVDLDTPAIAVSDTLDTRYNPVDEFFGVQVIDTATAADRGPSGIALTRVQLRSFACAVGALECAPAAGTVAAGTVSATPNAPGNATGITQAIGVVVDVFNTDVNVVTSNQYHQYVGRVYDRAGNVSQDENSIVFIRDSNPGFPPIDSILPVVSNVNIPPVALFNGGQAYPFAATVSDNVDLRRATAGFDFGADEYRIPFEVIPLTSFGPDAVVLSRLLNQETRYVRSLSVLTDSVTADSIGTPTMARFVAFDHSNWIGGFSTQANNIVENTRDPGFVHWFLGEGSTNSGLLFANWDDQGRWVVGGTTGIFQNPFARVHFYVRLENVLDDAGNPLLYHIGTVTAPSSIQDGFMTNYRVFRFTPPLLPEEIVESEEEYTVIAVGVSSVGDALMSTDGPTGPILP